MLTSEKGIDQFSTIPHNKPTLPLKSILPLVSVWSKNALNTGGVGGAGAGVDPQT